MDPRNRIRQELRYLRERWHYLNPTHPLRKSTASIISAFLGLVKILLWITLLVTIGYFAWNLARSPLETIVAERRMVPICKNLDQNEALEIESYLDDLEIRHKLAEDTTAVYVLPEELSGLRWQFIAGGFPRNGRLWYGLRDSIDISSEKSLRKPSGRSALELELGTTLLELEDVEFSNITIETSAEENAPPGASIELITRSETETGKEMRDTVIQLMQASVEGIRPESVSISIRSMDSFFGGWIPSDSLRDDSSKIQRQLERMLEFKTQTLLDKIIGQQRSMVRIRITLDADEILEGKDGGTHIEEGTRTVMSSTDIIAQLAISLVIDWGKAVVDPGRGEYVFEKRSMEELDQLANLVEATTGFDSSRGDTKEVLALHFGADGTWSPKPVKEEEISGFDQAFKAQNELERIFEAKVQLLMDQIIGKQRSAVRINAPLDLVLEAGQKWDASTPESLIPIVKNLFMAMVIDETKVVVDAASGHYIEEPRGNKEIMQLSQLARETVGFDEGRGDQITVFAMQFDYTQEIRARQEAETEARREFWTNITINVAKILTIIALLLVLRFIVHIIRQRSGARNIEEESFAEQTDVLLEEYTRELETAREMQIGLMPRESPRIQGLDIAGSCRPATHVGGDFFQYLRIDDERWWICVADATGHGMGAAIPVVMFSGVLKSQIQTGSAMEELLEQLNKSMHGTMTGDTLTGRTFVCFSGGEVDLSARTFRLSNAGCPFPFHYKAATGEVVELEVSGYPLGVRPYHSFQILEIPLESRDRIVFCTDGIIEADDQYGDMFGFDRASYLIGEGCRKGLSAEELRDYLMEQVHIFAEGKAQEDDQTVVVIGVE